MTTYSTAPEQSLSDSQRNELVNTIDRSPIFELFPLLNKAHLLRLFRKYYLELKDVRELTGYSRGTIWKMEKEGKLIRCPNTGLRRPRFTIDAVLECFGREKRN